MYISIFYTHTYIPKLSHICTSFFHKHIIMFKLTHLRVIPKLGFKLRLFAK